jgi:hypothetical protein
VTVAEVDQHLVQKLSKALTELPAAYNQLHLFQLPGSRPSDTGSKQRHGTLSTRAPLVLEVLDLLDRRHKNDVEPTRDNYELDRLVGQRRLGVLPTLSQWVRLVDSEQWDSGLVHAAPAEIPTVESECGWLQSHVEWISQQGWLQEIADDLTRMLKDCTLITGTTEQHIKMTCTNLGCGWPVQEEADGAWFKCTGCGRSWGRLELHKMAERKKPKPLIECAKLAGVSDRTLNRLIEAGLLKHVARDGTRYLYDIDAVMKATMNLRYRSA